MAQKVSLIVYPAKDLASAKALFTKFLASDPYVDGPYYVGYRAGDLEVGLDPNGEAVVGYVDVVDIKSSLQGLVDAGAQIHQDIKDVAEGLLIAQVRDPGGNILGLRQLPK